MADTTKIELYIKQGKNYIPFKSYMITGSEGTEYYHYLKKDVVKYKLINRWAVMHFCGKNIIANKQTDEDGLEVTPNDIVALPRTFSYKRLFMLFLFAHIVGTICWALRFQPLMDVFTTNAMKEYLKINIEVLFLLLLACIGGYAHSCEAKSDAKEWNSQVIPDEKLKK